MVPVIVGTNAGGDVEQRLKAWAIRLAVTLYVLFRISKRLVLNTSLLVGRDIPCITVMVAVVVTDDPLPFLRMIRRGLS